MSSTITGNRAPALAGVMISGLVISLVVLVLRFYARLVIVRKTGADDWFALISFICLIVAFGLFGASITYGLGQHAANLEPDNIMFAMKLVWMAFQFTPSAEATGKISVAFLLMRITTNKFWRWGFWVLIVLNILINIGMMFSILMSCWPVRILWDPMVPGHCDILERNIMSYVQGASAAISDIILAVVPVILLWNVQTTRKTKWLLCGLLSLGLFTGVAGFIRLAFTTETYSQMTAEDPTWGLMDFITWKCVELGLSVIVGCLPTLRPIFDKHSWARIYTRGTGGYSKRSGGSGGSATGSKKNMEIFKSNEFQVDFGSTHQLQTGKISFGGPEERSETV